MIENLTTTEHMTSEQIARTLSVMASQQARFEAEVVRLQEALGRLLPPIAECADVPRNQRIIDSCFTEKILALLFDRDQIQDRIAVLEEKIQRITELIKKYSTLQAIPPPPPLPDPK
jgi:hypothetical protein